MPRTLRDASLRAEAEELRGAYLAARVAELSAQRAAYAKARDAADGRKGAAGGRRPAGGRGGARGGGRGGSGGRAGGAGVADFAQALVEGGCGEQPGGPLPQPLLRPPAGAGAEAAAAEESEEDDGADGEGGSAGGSGGGAGPRDAWFVAAIDALEAAGRGREAADAVREALLESEQYSRAGAQNATSLARRCAARRAAAKCLAPGAPERPMLRVSCCAVLGHAQTPLLPSDAGSKRVRVGVLTMHAHVYHRTRVTAFLSRFKSLGGLKLLLTAELDAIAKTGGGPGGGEGAGAPPGPLHSHPAPQHLARPQPATSLTGRSPHRRR